jgi:hypothetical protein
VTGRWIWLALGVTACSFTPSGGVTDDAAVDAVDAPIDARPCGPDYVDGYRYYATQGTWLDAEQECERDNGHLAVLDSPAARAAAVAAAQRSNTSAELWVGLVRDQSGAAGRGNGTVTGAPASSRSAGPPASPTTAAIRPSTSCAWTATPARSDRDFTDASLRALCQCDGGRR